MEYADLHIHSTFSDGSLTPSEIVALAKKVNLKAIALTDHDNISGLSEGRQKAKEENIEFIEGVEFSCHDADCKKIHILGLFVKDLKKIEELASANRVSRHASMELILDHLRTAYGINLTFDFLHKEREVQYDNGIRKRLIVSEPG
jgi:predicted metal-dependent phosphoesterase TrpH